MSLRIRLARGGAKKRPFYRIVVADIRAPRDGRFVEKIGTFNPLLPKDDESRVVLDLDRAKHWLSVGAKPTDRVLRFLDAAGLEKREARNNPQKALPGKKRLEREEEERQAAADAAEAASKAEAEAAEAPAEERSPRRGSPCRGSPCRRGSRGRSCGKRRRNQSRRRLITGRI